MFLGVETVGFEHEKPQGISPGVLCILCVLRVDSRAAATPSGAAIRSCRGRARPADAVIAVRLLSRIDGSWRSKRTGSHTVGAGTERRQREAAWRVSRGRPARSRHAALRLESGAGLGSRGLPAPRDLFR